MKMKVREGGGLPQSVCQIPSPTLRGKWVDQTTWMQCRRIDWAASPAVILTVWSPDLWHPNHLGPCQKGKSLGPNLLNQNLWGMEPGNWCFNWTSKWFRNRPVLRTTDPEKRAPSCAVSKGPISRKQVIRDGDKRLRQDWVYLYHHYTEDTSGVSGPEGSFCLKV